MGRKVVNLFLIAIYDVVSVITEINTSHRVAEPAATAFDLHSPPPSSVEWQGCLLACCAVAATLVMLCLLIDDYLTEGEIYSPGTATAKDFTLVMMEMKMFIDARKFQSNGYRARLSGETLGVFYTYWESQRMPSPYPCRMTTEHMKISTGRMPSRGTLPLPAAQLMSQLLLAYGIRMVDLVAQDQEWGLLQLLHAQQGVQLSLALNESLRVLGIDQEHDAGDFGEVVLPQATGLLVSAEIEGGEAAGADGKLFGGGVEGGLEDGNAVVLEHVEEGGLACIYRK
ncbi:Small COPII coat GTPase [Hortaea werneckii]|nr:Small COPII coat GTPase [Hortaea werneckii]